MENTSQPPGFPPGLTLDQKWDFLRPQIEELYVDEGLALNQVGEHLKTRYSFDANENQYKYRIKKWKFKKNVSAAKKTAINNKMLCRPAGTSTSVARYKGCAIAEKKLRRQAKSDIKTSRATSSGQGESASECNLSAFAGKIFMNWNIPYKPSKAPSIITGDNRSPFPSVEHTPSDISFGSPASHQMKSPGGPQSPYSSALQKKLSTDRAWMFLDGKLQNIVGSMTHEEQTTMSTWLYQFWFFAFKTSKYWGRGPRYWVADYLGFSRNEATNFPTPTSHTSPIHVVTPIMNTWDGEEPRAEESPSQLCRWSIHVRETRYKALPGPPPKSEKSLHVHKPETYEDWAPSDLSSASYPNTLRDALESNDFSNIQRDVLPVAVPQVLQTATRWERDLVPESLGFAIMSRNIDMLEECCYKHEDRKATEDSIASINAFHLAASYLDGAKSCCLILNTLSGFCPLRGHYTNDLGHTVLDSLMIVIVKSHTSCKPESVDGAFRGSLRFPAEEMDICGRWDADSECIRQLLMKGKHRIPFHWKHKFCHTSTQVICDAITTIWGCFSAPDINTLSGLFIKRCSTCGLKMQITPLHTLVLVMFQLSTRGCKGEDLFGMVAVLLCLLRNGSDPRRKSSVAVTSLLGDDSTFEVRTESSSCHHEELDPLQFALNIFEQYRSQFPPETVLGWHICIEVLLHSQRGWELSLVDSASEDESSGEDNIKCSKLCNGCCDEAENFFEDSPELGLLWAVAQTELATYRRISLNDSWMSQYIDLRVILVALQSNSIPAIPLLKRDMMTDLCQCGRFLSNYDDDCIMASKTCRFYFTNMEDWSRSSFLDEPDRTWWDGWPVEETMPTATMMSAHDHETDETYSEPPNITTQPGNGQQASSLVHSPVQSANIPEYMQDPGENTQHVQEDINLENAFTYDAATPMPWWMPGGYSQQAHVESDDGDTDMYGV